MPRSTRAANAFPALPKQIAWPLVAFALVVVLVFMAFKSRADAPVPSFDEPLGTLDSSRVPNGWATNINAAAKVAGIPAPILAAQLETESHWDPNAVSSAGAQGLAQFTPGTWKDFGSGDPFSPTDAIAAQGRLLKHLKKQVSDANLTGNTTKLTLAAYNAGLGNVTKHGGVPPFKETKNYVKRIAQRMGHYALPIAREASSSSSAAAEPGLARRPEG